MTRVLVVDDEPDYPQLLSIILGKEGFEVQTASNGDEALQLAAEFAPDVLVIDWVLEGSKDGLQVAGQLAESNPGVRTVLITGYPSLDLEHRVNEIPSARLLTKPFTPSHLVQLVREAAGSES